MEHWSRQVRDLLVEAAERGLHVDSRARDRLLTYCAAVHQRASESDLVSLKDIVHLVDKHVAASLGVLLLEMPVSGEHWIDVGTGGGFPGMVIKISRPETPIVLLDSSDKKTRFLERIGRDLGLDGLNVVRGRVEELGKPDLVEVVGGSLPASLKFDVILMRAVASLPQSLQLIDSVAARGARLLTYKGPGWESELAAGQETIDRLGWRFEGVHEIPWARSRILRLVRPQG